jgi:hypothetical protein
MRYVLIAVVAGVLVGLLLGGRPQHVGRRPLRAGMALGAAVLLQVVPNLVDVDGSIGLACVLGSYALLLLFTLANIRLVGMSVVLLGLLLNIAVITANGGMPVRPEAIRSVDPDVDLTTITFDAKRHLETSDDLLTPLGDVLPVAPLGEVLSFGDLIMAAGIANVVFRLLKPFDAPRRNVRRPLPEVVAMLPARTMTELPEPV